MDWNVSELLGDEQEQQRLAIENYLNNLRVAMPGIIQDFNADNQTATVQPAIKEQINGEWLSPPLLPDVPVQFPRAGGYCMTFPVKKGDECLVIFNDMCIDSWWQSGKVQTQLEKRRHDLSDAVAVLGITSVPKALKGFSENSMQIRNDKADTVIDFRDNNITITAEEFNIKNKNLNIESDKITLTGNDITLEAEEINLNAPNITLHSENVEVTGEVTINGSISVSGNANVSGDIDVAGDVVSDGDVTASGISLVNHVHPYAWTAEAGSNNTSPPS